MTPAIIARLNAVNREFYHITAAAFAATRGVPWPGWERLLPHLPTTRPLSVLDVGCGNGRFGLFLAGNREHLRAAPPQPQSGALFMRYHGVDSNPALLDYASEALAALPGVECLLEERDIIERPPDAGEYDLIALFGLLHHVPGGPQRQGLLRALAARVRPGGLLAFACWRFYEEERLRARIIPWPEDLADEVEAGDYLLDWRRGEHALRYCHYVDDAEHAVLVAATGLETVLDFRADGHSGQSNRYALLGRAATPTPQ